VSNVLSEEKKQQVIALGRLGWSLRRIEAAVHIRRETIGGYLRAAGIPVRSAGGWGRRGPANPANEVITDSGAGSGTISVPQPHSGRNRSTSACELYSELIQLGPQMSILCTSARSIAPHSIAIRLPPASAADTPVVHFYSVL